MQRVAVCCSVLQCVAVCCSLQCVAVLVRVFCSVLQCVAVCCSVVQRVAVSYSVQCCERVAMCCSSCEGLLQVRCTGPVCGYVDSYRAVCNAGWRRPIGCLKLQVIFRKRAVNYRALSWKMTYKDKASYGSSPQCTSCSTFANQMICGFTGFL